MIIMRKCTDPERWGVVPGADASEEEAEAYLLHTRKCAFHAKIEKRNQKMVEAITKIARSSPRDGNLFLPMVEIARIRESLNRSGETAAGSPIGTAWQWMNQVGAS